MPRSFEQPATIALAGPEGERGLALEGLFVPGPDAECAGAVIAPPHPLYGGSMDNPVVTELAHACAHCELASLRFNWRGVGASGGAMSGEASDAVADYQASLAFLDESVEGTLAAFGYSFGAVAAVSAAHRDPRVRRLLLVSPPFTMLDRDKLEAFGGPVLIVVGEDDAVASPTRLEAVARELPKGSFVLLPDTDHFFQGALAPLGQAAHRWLAG